MKNISLSQEENKRPSLSTSLYTMVFGVLKRAQC